MSRPEARVAAAVLGCGGIGGLIAARTGALCVGTKRSVSAIRSDGVRLEHGGRTTIARPEAVERLERPVDLLVVCVKAYDLESALERIPAETVAGAVVLPLQNGLEHVAAIRAHFEARDTGSPGRPTVAAGSIGRVEAFSPEPGVVVQRTPGAARITAASDEHGPEALATALEPLRVPGIEVVPVEDERAVLWEKAARLAVLAAAAVASRRAAGALRDDGVWRHRLCSALAEACAVARAEGIEVDPAEQWAIIESLPADLIPSAARDAAAGRRTELDAITGSVVRAGDRVGVPTPELARLLDDALAQAHA